MKNITQTLKTILLAIILSFGISFVYAWTGPTATPPAGNTTAPINTSTDSQYKNGALGVGGVFRGYSSAIFDGNVGIGTTNPLMKLHINGGWGYITGTGNGGDPATRFGIYDTDNTGGVTGWWLSHNNDGKFAIHQNAVGDRLSIDHNTGNIEISSVGAGIKFPDGTVQTTAGGGGGGGGVFGGMYATVVGGGTCIIINPFTNGCSCPTGYFAYSSGPLYRCSGATDCSQYFCSNTAPSTAVINNFSISPAIIGLGQASTFTWSSTGASSCSGSVCASSPSWGAAQGLSGNSAFQMVNPGIFSCGLSCANNNGSQSDFKTAPITVKSWQDTVGVGNPGESCNAWLARTGQAGVNGNAPRAADNSNYDSPGNCIYSDGQAYNSAQTIGGVAPISSYDPSGGGGSPVYIIHTQTTR